jgi:hypothetical protein
MWWQWKKKELRTAIMSVVTSVCLSVAMEQLGSQWTDFYKV